MAKQPLDPEAPLNEYEKYLLEKLLDPANLSDKFKKWVLDYVPVNGKFDKATLLGATALGGMAHLETKKLASAQANVDFVVPAGYTHLKLIGSADNAGGAAGINMQFNGDTGANYGNVEEGYLPGTGRTDSEALAITSARVGVSYNQSTAGRAPFETTIFDYAGATHNKRWLSIFGAWDGTHLNIRQALGSWGNNTAPITSIRLLISSGANFTSGSVFSLYGLV